MKDIQKNCRRIINNPAINALGNSRLTSQTKEMDIRMKNIFYIFCVFCLLCSPCFSQNLSKNTEVNNKLTYDNYSISALNLNAINSAFKNANSNNNDDNVTPLLMSLQQKKEFETTKIPKGTKFHVRSKQDISDNSKNGTKVSFESTCPQNITNNHATSKLIFKGKIVKSRNPQAGCNGGLIKIKIDKMTIGNITYPVNGMVTKINDKRVLFNNIKGDSSYLYNTITAANMKNGTLHNLYQEPCTKICGDGNAVIAPIYLLGGAVLQTSNLLLSPVAALFKSGKNVNIQKNSDFIIKLEENVFVLKM